LGVYTIGIMVEESEAAGASRYGDVCRVLDGAVTPAEAIRIFGFGVLSVVDHKISALQKLDVALIARMPEIQALVPPEWLVVRGVSERHSVPGNAVRDSGRRVVQVLSFDEQVANSKEALLQLGEVDP